MKISLLLLVWDHTCLLSNTQAWDPSYVQIFLYLSQRCCILAQRGSFAVKIIYFYFCIFRHAFLFSFVQHTCSSSSSVHKALENGAIGEISYWMYAQVLKHKKQRVLLAVTTFAYRYHLINCLLPLGLNMQRRLGKAERRSNAERHAGTFDLAYKKQHLL